MPRNTMLNALIEESHDAFGQLQMQRQNLIFEHQCVDRGWVDPAPGAILIRSAEASVYHAEVVAKQAKKALLEYLGLA